MYEVDAVRRDRPSMIGHVRGLLVMARLSCNLMECPALMRGRARAFLFLS